MSHPRPEPWRSELDVRTTVPNLPNLPNLPQRSIGDRTVSAIGLGGMPMSIEGRPDADRAIATIHAALDPASR